jgi:hypothetical protein
VLYQIVVLSFVGKGRHVYPVTVVVLQRLRELAAYLEVLIRRIDTISFGGVSEEKGCCRGEGN